MHLERREDLTTQSAETRTTRIAEPKQAPPDGLSESQLPRSSSARRGEAVPENMRQPEWKMQPDGSRVRLSNGITIIDRSARARAAAGAPADIEHLITWRQPEGEVVILGLDAHCRPVYATTLSPARS